jgi:uncharacterized membrane protein
MKKDKSSTETESKTYLNASKTDKSKEAGGSFILRPFNPSKPIINGKDTIYNATIEKHYYTKDRIVKDTVAKKETVETDIDTKNVERDNTTLFLGIAGVICFFLFLIVLVILWYINKKLTI